jgi:hypothetical protein
MFLNVPAGSTPRVGGVHYDAEQAAPGQERDHNVWPKPGRRLVAVALFCARHGWEPTQAVIV